MNNEQRKILKDALITIDCIRIELEDKINNLEENFPNHSKLDDLNDEFDRLDTICDELEDLIS